MAPDTISSTTTSTVDAVPVTEGTANDDQAKNNLGDEESTGELDFSFIDVLNNQSLVDRNLTDAGFAKILSIQPSNPMPLRTARTDLKYVSYSS